MKTLLERARYLVLLAVLACLVASGAAFAWGVLKTAASVVKLATDYQNPLITLAFIEVMDAFLVAVALALFGTALYALFIEDLDVPAWMVVHNLHQLKVRLSSLVILVLGIKFLEFFTKGAPALDVLYVGLGISLVCGMLIAFTRFAADE
jgi:uncharacterized membrane protein YqhA